MKKIICLVMIFITIISALVPINLGASEKIYSWYVKRRSGNLKPVTPSEFSFIKDYDAYWIDDNYSDDSPEKAVYLTFDAGYENGNVEKILNILKEKNAPGAFFVLGHFIKSNPQLIIRMINEGHTVCNHTANHKDMSKIKDIENFRKELEALEKIYYDHTGKDMAKIYRPPEGKFSDSNLEFARSLGYKTVFWSVAYEDWDNNAQPGHEYAKSKLLNNIHNGAIILLHPTSATNAAILSDLIDDIRNKGYEIKAIENLFN